ncbi:hypothetical protein B296_00039142, partial [Ensete ventricosum]
SFSQKECPNPFAPSTLLPPPSLPYQGATTPTASSAPGSGTSTGAAPLRTASGRRFYSQAPPLRAAAPTGDRLQAASVCRPLHASSASLAGGQAVAGRCCREPGHGQPL